ncbi:MAG: hypothetical protein ACRYG7_21200 [Janthinobacterium lividum]
MRTPHVAALAALSLLTMSNACHKETAESPCPSLEITTAQVAGLGNNPNCYSETPPPPGQFKNHVINSAAEYNALFNCPPPAVNFNTYTLLIGKTVTTSGNFIKAQRVQQACTNYTYTVDIQLGLTAVVQQAVYHTLVPKLPADAQVTFNIQVLP